ncbi:MAG: hypothetical protein GOV02_02550 [Candidatus Aenigmarchaeota archaeon]|nr:hypothetical protein [Candidatus Aenigmarchaeota archaeon]
MVAVYGSAISDEMRQIGVSGQFMNYLPESVSKQNLPLMIIGIPDVYR